jgi:undecaprenyl-diphosphatase
LVLACLALACALPPAAAGAEDAAAADAPDRSLSYRHAVVLGLVEGLTEYLPVSSTGHLILTNRFLGLDTDDPVLRPDGTPILVPDGAGGKRPYTAGEAAYAYTIVIQAGAILAVVLVYRRRILEIILGCLGRSREGRRLAVNIVVAFLPAAVVGLLLEDLIETHLGGNIVAVAGALIAGAVVMEIVEHWRRHGSRQAIDPHSGPELHELSARRALVIGVCQCFAMWPGTSRSMATIVGGYIVGLSPARAAEFSFLLGLVTLTAASGYKFVSDGREMLAALDAGPVLAGILVAFVSAALAVKWLVGYLSRHGLALFAWYRIALAILVLLFLL